MVTNNFLTLFLYGLFVPINIHLSKYLEQGMVIDGFVGHKLGQELDVSMITLLIINLCACITMSWVVQMIAENMFTLLAVLDWEQNVVNN